MNRDDVIRMAREAGMLPDNSHPAPQTRSMADKQARLERFAALVAAAERNRAWTQDHWTEYERSIAAAEREACAKVADDWGTPHADRIAAAIRARGQA